MLPLQQSYEVKHSILEYLKATYSFKDRNRLDICTFSSLWSTSKDCTLSETSEHTITKSEVYYGKKVTYYTPFDKCDWVEDYKVV